MGVTAARLSGRSDGAQEEAWTQVHPSGGLAQKWRWLKLKIFPSTMPCSTSVPLLSMLLLSLECARMPQLLRLLRPDSQPIRLAQPAGLQLDGQAGADHPGGEWVWDTLSHRLHI